MTDHANRETPGQYAACFVAAAIFFVMTLTFVTQMSPARHDAPATFTMPPVATIADSGFTQTVATSTGAGRAYTRAE